MDATSQEVEIILGLLAIVVALVTIARRINAPYPVLLVLGGLALAFVPHLPRIELKPNLVFLIFLPPLLYYESLTSSLRDFRRNARPISLLAIGLVLFTTSVIAMVAHALLPGMTWPAAFVLGAVLAPTDEIAVTEVAERLALPSRILTILEGESLANDAISLVAFRLAVAAIVTGAFSLWQAGLQFIWVSVGGIAIGWGIGWAGGWARRHLHSDPAVENTISLLSPFAAYLCADTLGVSGVLAVITAGLYQGQLSPRIVTSGARLQAKGFWEMLTFLLNGLLFLLTGLQLQRMLHTALPASVLALLGYSALMVATLIVTRFGWVFLSAYALRALLPSLRRRDPYPPWQQITLIGWVGIRGGTTLIAALAIPFTVAGGKPFPDRELIIILAFSAILATLLLQGVTLPWTIRVLRLVDDGIEDSEEMKARIAASRAALAHLEKVAAPRKAAPVGKRKRDGAEDADISDIIEDLREHYTMRLKRFTAHAQGEDTRAHDARAAASQELRQALIRAQRDTILRLRDEGAISDDVLRTVQNDLDLEEERLGEIEADTEAEDESIESAGSA